jgi:hypothetical protein
MCKYKKLEAYAEILKMVRSCARFEVLTAVLLWDVSRADW